MNMWQVYFETLGILLALGAITWVVSVFKKDVSIVDSLWSIMFLVAALYVVWMTPEVSTKSWLLLGLVTLWALRLSIFITIRNWGESEDRRYREIRSNNNPNFAIKSLIIVFGLQAVLAWIISIVLLPGLYLAPDFSPLDSVAIGLWGLGMFFEVKADLQLYAFKQNPASKGKVLDTGLWRYSRHPNYFGEFLVWWAFFLMVVTTGAWWSVIAPIVMTVLLLKVSGVGLMEKDITERRPLYQRYIETTNAFFPWPPRKVPISEMEVNKS